MAASLSRRLRWPGIAARKHVDAVIERAVTRRSESCASRRDVHHFWGGYIAAISPILDGHLWEGRAYNLRVSRLTADGRSDVLPD